MITKTKKVYYCEYCRKHRHTSDSMMKHEKGCTKNPNRDCGLCEGGAGNLLPIIAKWKEILEPVNFYLVEDCSHFPNTEGLYSLKADEKKIVSSITDINSDVDECPICTLAVLRLVISKRKGYRFHWFEHFDYKAKLKNWWDTVNADAEEANSFSPDLS